MNDEYDPNALSKHPRDEIVDTDLSKLEERIAGRKVIVIGGDGYSADTIHRMLAEKGVAGEYEILTHAEAGERGLLREDVPVPLLSPTGRRLSTPQRQTVPPNPERDRWNAAVDEQKAAKRRAKGRP